MDKIINQLGKTKSYFIGIEDPDIFINKDKHVFFTIAFKKKNDDGYWMYLGHAKGKSLDKLKASMPVLSPQTNIDGFKESTLPPTIIKPNTRGTKLNIRTSVILSIAPPPLVSLEIKLPVLLEL